MNLIIISTSLFFSICLFLYYICLYFFPTFCNLWGFCQKMILDQSKELLFHLITTSKLSISLIYSQCCR